MRNYSLAVLLCCAVPSQAQTPALGYVVRADSMTVYLDLAASNGISLGQDFVVFTEGEELKHPITGASLGKVEHQVAKGHIQQIMDRYSVGQLDVTPSAKVATGQKIRMLSSFTASAVPTPALPASATAAAPTSAPAPSAPTTIAGAISNALGLGGNRTPSPGAPLTAVWKSPPMDMEAVEFALGDINGDGKPEILLAETDHISAYPQTGDWKPICQYKIPETASKILGLDALDLKKAGHADVFVTYYNGVFEHAETAILECKNGAFEKTATLPYIVRSFQDATGAIKLGAQQLIDDKTFPFGNIYELVYKDGKYATGQQIKAKRVDWLYGFTMAKDATDGRVFPIFITSTQSLRAQFKKKAWVSEDSFGQTSNRLTWQGRDRPLMFYPRMIAAEKNGALDGLYVLENIASLGTLGGAFGYYGDAKLHFLRWDGLSLKRERSTDSLGGYAADVDAVRSPDGQIQELWVAVVGSGGRTSVVKFQP